jgi:RHS repeat-associated protein
MANNSNHASQNISLPKGGGALQGIGEKFSPDLHTGTGNFTVPIALPPGRNGFQPQLNLVYSTGNGNGPFGLGWNLSIPGVGRQTAKGIPRYRDYDPDLDKRDIFILSGAEDLVPVEALIDEPSRTVVRYRPRTEGLFARILHHYEPVASRDFWEVRTKDGLVSYYGTNPAPGEHPVLTTSPPRDPSVIFKISDPPSSEFKRIFAWKLTLTKDPFGNRIEYLYTERDQSAAADENVGHKWDQPLLKQIRYVDYGEPTDLKFLVTVTFTYEPRPDPFSEYRGGFELRTTKRCSGVLVETHADTDRKVRKYEFTYINDGHNAASRLKGVNVVGFDDAGAEARELPPLEFGYSSFQPEDSKRPDFYSIQGLDLPAVSLANPDFELVDLFGSGLPDVLQMNGVVRYWRNCGNGTFDFPRPMHDAPPVALAAPGVQLIDANGDGRTDLLVTRNGLSGYFPLRFGGLWDQKSFQKYERAPSLNLEDPEVRLVDLTGDGVTDVIRSGTRLECFFNDPRKGWLNANTRWVERRGLEEFPNVNFSDPRVKWADISGDGLQDIVLVYDGNVEYWPNLGYGNWGKRIHMRNSPRFNDSAYHLGYDPRRILIGDVDGDGLADMIYVGHRKVTLWINQSGNSWSDPIEIDGTPPVSDMDAIRLVDLLGTGISGVLWSSDFSTLSRGHMFFLDLTGGVKPYLLNEMNNHMGAVTKVEYTPSTKFYLEDQKQPRTRWKTPLPFPVQVVSRVEVIDEISKGKLTTEYKYHHGYWDGAEREFRGFGMVEQLDTETFERYSAPGLHGVSVEFNGVEAACFSPPTLTRTWFHQGPIGEEFGDWEEADYSAEYWDGPKLLNHTEQVNAFLRSYNSRVDGSASPQDRRIKRDALRTLRGSILRTELYARDGTEREERPYTVTEHAYGLREESKPANGSERQRIFFPHLLAQRTTQWERGTDPLTQFAFTADYDAFGQPREQIQIGCPRGWRQLTDRPTDAYLATRVYTDYADKPTDPNSYIGDRVARVTTWELRNTAFKQVMELKDPITSGIPLVILGQTVNFYDGPAFDGLGYRTLGKHGALVRTEQLVLTDEVVAKAYDSGSIPPYLDHMVSRTNWTAEYPPNFKLGFPHLAGYRYENGAAHPEYAAGYFVATERRKYDFHDGTGRGLTRVKRDSLDRDVTVTYDKPYDLLPVEVIDPAALKTKARYNYRTLQPRKVTDPNENSTRFVFTPLGLLGSSCVYGENGEGDQHQPSVQLRYDFLAYRNTEGPPSDKRLPIFVRTIRNVFHDTDPDDTGETIDSYEYSDGFGRLIQTRTQAEEELFGNPSFGGEILPGDQNDINVRNPLVGQKNTSITNPNVVVSGWQIFDNKGRVVEKYEPFFDVGWNYKPPSDVYFLQSKKVAMFYDPRGQVVRTVNPEGSEQRVIYGVPGTISATALDDPAVFEPTPWEAYTYDANDNAGRTHSAISSSYRHHYNTPGSIVIDALGRTVVATARTRAPGSPLQPIEEHRTLSTYDLRGNLVTVTDALGRVAFAYLYDLLNRPLRMDSIDAGIRRSVLDAAGNVVERRDSKGAVALTAYDKLNRPTHVWARNDALAAKLTLRERLEYGDGGDPAQPLTERSANRTLNRLGKLARHYDEAGVLTLDQYDFKGNLTEKKREVIADSAIAAGLGASGSPVRSFVVDWDSPSALDGNYQTSLTYDALNRVKTMRYPQDSDGERKLLRPHYNRAGALESVELNGAIYVERIAYNAKGQRVLIAYGNDVMTRYAYELQTFRLVRLRTERYFHPDLLTYRPSGGLLQDFAYEYDLVGNMMALNDQVSGCGVRGTPEGDDILHRHFEYDPLYRLTRTTGRESINISSPRPWEDLPRNGFNSRLHGTANQDNAPQLTRLYWEEYAYDPAGNMLEFKHGEGFGGAPRWTRHFGMGGRTPQQWNQEWRTHQNAPALWTSPPGNQLTHVGDDQPGVAQSHFFDANGNLIKENTQRHFAWDHVDRMVAFATQPSTGGIPSVQACYLYGADGMRVKKFVRKGNRATHDESTVYIDGVFEQHKWAEVGASKQNNHFHVMDNQSRIAIVRVGDRHPDDGGEKVQYHLGDHLGSNAVVVGGDNSTTSAFINREEYFPYGETSFGSFAKKRYHFTGKQMDEESDLYYFGARYYAAHLARWASGDPLGILQKDKMTKNGSSQNSKGLAVKLGKINLYCFARPNPLAYTDPDGRDVYMIIYARGKENENEFEKGARTRAREIESGRSFDPKKDRVFVFEIEDLGKLKQEVVERVNEAKEKGYGKTVELSFYSHTGREDGPRALRPTSENLAAHASHGRNQMKLAGWKDVDFNWAEKDTVASFYGCHSLNFAKKFASIQPVQYVTGYNSDAYPSQRRDEWDSPIVGFGDNQDVYWVGGVKGSLASATFGSEPAEELTVMETLSPGLSEVGKTIPNWGYTEATDRSFSHKLPDSPLLNGSTCDLCVYSTPP